MKVVHYILSFLILVTMMNCKGVDSALEVTVYETSESGNALKKVNEFSTSEKKVVIQLNPEEKFQTITIN